MEEEGMEGSFLGRGGVEERWSRGRRRGGGILPGSF